jgi:DNA polymerase III delta prime subunit
MTGNENDVKEVFTEKYRPKNFNEVFGNLTSVKRLRMLTTAEKGSVRNFLLTGPSGCGKTSIAKILIKKLTKGRCFVSEINAGNFRGIETIRKISGHLHYAGKKLFFFDEAHCLTRESQEALLKPLELDRRNGSEVYFIFSTTEPDKLIKPFINRCEHLPLNPLTYEESSALINRICDGEGKALSPDLKNLISGKSKGIPREIVNNVGKGFSDPNLLKDECDSKTFTLFNSPDNYIMPFKRFYDLKLPERKMIMSPWLLEGDLIMLTADSGTGKSLFAMEITAACSIGRKAINGLWVPTRSNPVLYIDGEMHWDDIKDRGKSFGLNSGLIFSKTFYYYNNGSPPFYITEEKIRNFLIDYIIKNKIKLVILDNIDSLSHGLDLSSAIHWSTINQWLLSLRSFGVSVILVHHTNRKGDPLGTSTRRFNLDYSFILRDKRSFVKTNSIMCAFSIKVDKVRRGLEEIERKIFICDNGKWDAVDLTESDEKKQRGRKEDKASREKKARIILKIIEGKKQSDIAEEVGVKPPYITTVKKSSINNGLIHQVRGSSIYELTELGRKWIDKVLQVV